MSRTKYFTRELASILRNAGPDADARWRRLFSESMGDEGPSQEILQCTWKAILEFDPVLRQHITKPIALNGPAVIVAGSGKEQLKTFNVTTASALLAASAGARVVKGVSESVSAVSGSADVLVQLGVPTCDDTLEVPDWLGRYGIALTPYASFCPSYGPRYDGVFTDLTPARFFMPIAVLAVQAHAYVFGVAHRNVSLALDAIAAARPDLAAGIVVAAEPFPGQVMDEYVRHGISYLARRDGENVRIEQHRYPPPEHRWASRVAHRSTHGENARLVLDALQPGPANPARSLVEQNAALIFNAHHRFAFSDTEAYAAVEAARCDGRATRLLSGLQAIRRTHDPEGEQARDNSQELVVAP